MQLMSPQNSDIFKDLFAAFIAEWQLGRMLSIHWTTSISGVCVAVFWLSLSSYYVIRGPAETDLFCKYDLLLTDVVARRLLEPGDWRGLDGEGVEQAGPGCDCDCVYGGRGEASCGQLSKHTSSDPGQPGPSRTDYCLTLPPVCTKQEGVLEARCIWGSAGSLWHLFLCVFTILIHWAAAPRSRLESQDGFESQRNPHR